MEIEALGFNQFILIFKAIFIVTQDGMAQFLKVHPNLMGAPCLELRLSQSNRDFITLHRFRNAQGGVTW